MNQYDIWIYLASLFCFKLLSSAPNFEGLHYSLFSSCSSALACHIQWASCDSATSHKQSQNCSPIFSNMPGWLFFQDDLAGQVGTTRNQVWSVIERSSVLRPLWWDPALLRQTSHCFSTIFSFDCNFLTDQFFDPPPWEKLRNWDSSLSNDSFGELNPVQLLVKHPAFLASWNMYNLIRIFWWVSEWS
jgi:hypothetical protein